MNWTVTAGTATLADANAATTTATITASATVQANFTAAVNQPPVAADQALICRRNTNKDITLTATDPEGDPLTFQIVTVPAHGTLSALTGDTLTYTPAVGYVGPDSFQFVANDGTQDSAPATVTLTVKRKKSVLYLPKDNDGCALSATPTSAAGWWLTLAALLALGALRRGYRVLTARR